MKEQHLEAAAPGSSSKVVYETCSGLVAGGGGGGWLSVYDEPTICWRNVFVRFFKVLPKINEGTRKNTRD